MKHNLLLYILLIITVFSLLGCNQKNGLGLNEDASIKDLGNLPENPLLLDAITESIDIKENSMAVLYGNELAYNHAKISGDGNYPDGSVLYNVTWRLQEDEQWFGANIPENIQTIERIEFLSDNKTKYDNYNSKGIKNAVPSDDAQKRINHMKEMKIAVSP